MGQKGSGDQVILFTNLIYARKGQMKENKTRLAN